MICLKMIYILYLQGHEKEALNLMSTYLPKDSGPGSAYSEGGGLYALGRDDNLVYFTPMWGRRYYF